MAACQILLVHNRDPQPEYKVNLELQGYHVTEAAEGEQDLQAAATSNSTLTRTVHSARQETSEAVPGEG